jgi:hypothetical protein
MMQKANVSLGNTKMDKIVRKGIYPRPLFKVVVWMASRSWYDAIVGGKKKSDEGARKKQKKDWRESDSYRLEIRVGVSMYSWPRISATLFHTQIPTCLVC